MGVLCAVTFQRREVLQVVCEYFLVHSLMPTDLSIANAPNRFAFVEYESRRDADDAYHEMHNTRIGRDDLLKIEVHFHCTPQHYKYTGTDLIVGSYSSICILAI